MGTITPRGLEHDSRMFLEANGNLFCIGSLDDFSWQQLDPDGSYQRSKGGRDRANNYIRQACNKLGPQDLFFDKDSRGHKKFNEGKFNRCIYWPPVEKSGYSTKLRCFFVRTVNGDIRVDDTEDEYGMEIPRAIADRMLALSDADAREALEFLRESEDLRRNTFDFILGYPEQLDQDEPLNE
jgi:hypothetical protein